MSGKAAGVSDNCCACVYYWDIDDGKGLCHYNPPVVILTRHEDGSSELTSERPEVYAEDYCSNHHYIIPTRRT